MFTTTPNVFILCYIRPMAASNKKAAHKHFRLNSAKIRKAQRLLRARTETETIERALDAVIAEHERDRIVQEAHERFLRSGIKIRDVFGVLDSASAK
jgi:hypothetical protein